MQELAAFRDIDSIRCNDARKDVAQKFDEEIDSRPKVKGQPMSLPGQRNIKFNWDDFERTTLGLRSLKSRLPADSVKSLAEEVIERVSKRGADTSEHSVHKPSWDQIEHLAFALMDDDAEASLSFIADIRDAGATTEEVYLAYLAGAARCLGEWWNDSHVSFMDVTLATSRIFGLLNALKSEDSMVVPASTPSAVFMTVPGEDHTLGVQMAADLFRRQGWNIDLLLGRKHDDLVRSAEAMQPAVIGISVAGDHSMVALAKLMVALRVHCPDTLIVISGAIMKDAEELVADLTPDAMVKDVSTAFNVLSDLWEVVQRRYAARYDGYP